LGGVFFFSFSTVMETIKQDDSPSSI